MVFSSIGFLFFFFPALMVCYFAFPRHFRTGRNIILLLFSMIFYACAGLRAVPLILLSSFLDFSVGRLLPKSSKPKTWLAIGLIIHLLLLFYFKYTVFAATSLNALGFSIPVPEIVLPIGISFFTFQGMSYLIDVYREDVVPETSFFRVLLYISFFPHLTAGPIVRYSHVAARIQDRCETVDDISIGFSRFFIGLGKKVLLSNAMAQIADAAFTHSPDSLSTALAWLGLLAYTAFIYFDFSGYSDMAIGLGRIFGFHFLENFNYPYISRSLTEFWRRWHISLGSWFREYLYIPLGGNRVGHARLIFNLLIVWAATGIWHGASWNFLVWGLYFGILLILEKFLLLKSFEHVPKFIQHIYALFFICLGWVWFRATDIPSAISYFSTLFSIGNHPLMEDQVTYLIHQFWPELLLTPFACTPILPWLKSKCREDSLILFCAQKITILLIALLSVFRLLSSGFNPFVYFRF